MINLLLMSKQIRVIISGGGTGGHIFPALAIADALKVEFPSIDILFIGARGKMEMQKVPHAGYPIKGLWISGFQRSLTLKNLLFPLRVLVSLAQTKYYLLRFRPHAVIGVGGYASGPTVFVARMLGMFTAIQEQNALPGMTNRILGKWVHRIYTAYPGMRVYFPEKKILCTGNPLRKQIQDFATPRTEGLLHFGLSPSKKTILVMGGSLGAGIFNECMAMASSLIETHSEDIQWIWQSGKSYEAQYAHERTASLSNVCFRAFLDDMDKAYAAADLVISRAGAMAIAELATLGKAAILTPSPFVAEDHQTVNAKALESKSAIVMITQLAAKERLISEAIELVKDEAACALLSKNVRAFAFENAAGKIAVDIFSHLTSRKYGS
jgi:UDP-N-acetylglucosamine--N-acetylmuramyl-(pentapeptide) pyrophosphoryl-undecaprenol N-acetylglucosamine transferase